MVYGANDVSYTFIFIGKEAWDITSITLFLGKYK